MREALQKMADAAGHSVGEEIRVRVEESLSMERAPSDLRRLHDAVNRFVNLVWKEIGANFNEDAIAARALRAAIDAYLERHHKAKEGFDSKEGPSPEEIGRDIEAADHAVAGPVEEAIQSLDKNLASMRESLAQLASMRESLAGVGNRKPQLEQAIASLTQQRRKLQQLLYAPDLAEYIREEKVRKMAQ
jgi:chromosome segregation ATPase